MEKDHHDASTPRVPGHCTAKLHSFIFNTRSALNSRLEDSARAHLSCDRMKAEWLAGQVRSSLQVLLEKQHWLPQTHTNRQFRLPNSRCVHVFRLWEEAGEPATSIEVPFRALNLTTLLLWDDSTNHCTTLSPTTKLCFLKIKVRRQMPSVLQIVPAAPIVLLQKIVKCQRKKC